MPLTLSVADAVRLFCSSFCWACFVIQKNSNQENVLHRIFLFVSRKKRSEHNSGMLFHNPGHNQKRRILCLLIMSFNVFYSYLCSLISVPKCARRMRVLVTVVPEILQQIH